MRILRLSGVRKYAFILALSLVSAIALEIAIFMCDKQVEYCGESVSLLDGGAFEYTANGYEISGNHYESVYEDSQLIFYDVDRAVSHICISFAERVRASVRVQVFYRGEDSDFSSDDATSAYQVPFAARYTVIEIPEGYYDALRIDIDGSFSLQDIVVSDEPVSINLAVGRSFSFARFMILFVILGVVGCAFLRWYSARNKENSLTAAELLFCLGCFAYYLVWMIDKPLNYAPDELMRYDVTRFLFENDRLPVGDELLSIWGFSYAHMPTVLCNWLGYFMMKIASVFTGNETILLLAARMPNVLAGVGAVYYTIKISKLLFKTPARWIMIVVLAFMPQFVFLTSYINNDMVAFVGITMIVYAWTLGMKDNWNFSNTSLLSMGISICALSYYNSYAWILMSVIFFFATYFYKNPRDYKGAAKYTGFIVTVVLLLVGYSFIRHLVIYGSLLGFEVGEYYGEKYAIEALKPSNRLSLLEQGVPLLSMLITEPYQWIRTTWLSCIGIFGFMQFRGPDLVYMLITVFVVIGIAGLVPKLVCSLFRSRKPDKETVLFWVLAALAAFITVMLSVYNSYTADFQAQGRYCYPAFLTLVFFLAKGYEWLLRLLKKDEYKYAAVSAICTGFVAFSLYMFWAVYLPS